MVWMEKLLATLATKGCKNCAIIMDSRNTIAAADTPRKSFNKAALQPRVHSKNISYDGSETNAVLWNKLI